MTLRGLCLAGMALLGACAAPRAIYFDQDATALYRPIEIGAAGVQGPVPLVLRGNPFGDPSVAFAAAAIVGLSRSWSLREVRLTTGDPGPRAVDYALIVVFGQPRLGANSLCADHDAPFAIEPRLNATAAFCIGSRMVSSARGRSFEQIKGPEDPAFAAFLQGLADALLPPGHPRLGDCDSPTDC